MFKCMSASSREIFSAGYALAYREARRELEDQERFVGELRGRAGTLIAAAAIATSFFGGQTLTEHGVGAVGWVAIGCFVLLGFTVLLMLGPEDFIATYLEPVDGNPMELHLVERDLALHMGHSIELNREQLYALVTTFRFGTLLLVIEVLAWVVALVAGVD